MYTVKIANKLDELYCIKAHTSLDKLYVKFYGIACPSSDFYPIDINLRIDMLEYYKQFSEEDLIDLISTSKCLKKLING